MAFHDFMAVAVTRRPVEQFEIQVAIPNWQIEPDEEAWYGAPDEGMMVDADGNPITPDGTVPPGDGVPRREPPPPPADGEEQLDQEWLDGVINRPRREPPPRRREEEEPLAAADPVE